MTNSSAEEVEWVNKSLSWPYPVLGYLPTPSLPCPVHLPLPSHRGSVDGLRHEHGVLLLHQWPGQYALGQLAEVEARIDRHLLGRQETLGDGREALRRLELLTAVVSAQQETGAGERGDVSVSVSVSWVSSAADSGVKSCQVSANAFRKVTQPHQSAEIAVQ